jgi:hypothetical protein
VIPPLRRGDFVRLTTDTGRVVEAMVTIASPNGRSIVVMFDAMIGGWAGMMPCFEHDDGTWRAIDDMPIAVARA